VRRKSCMHRGRPSGNQSDYECPMSTGLVVLEKFLVVRRCVAFFDLSHGRFGLFLERPYPGGPLLMPR
jgi:hypothetical protein